MLNKLQIKMLQTAVKKAGIRGKKSDGRYRLLLGNYRQSNGSKVTSCKQLNNSQLEDLLAICEAHGWRMPGKPADFFRQKVATRSDCASFAQQSAIKNLAGDLGWNDRNLAGFIDRQTKGWTYSLNEITPKQAWGIIEALKAMFSRQAGKKYSNLKDIKKDMELVMARVKAEKQALITINSFKEADAVLRDIGDLQTQIQEAESLMRAKIDEQRAGTQLIVTPMQEQIKNKVASLEVFCTAHRREFGGRQSMDLDFGVIGWRKSKSIVIKKTTLGLIKKIFSAAKAANFIRITESANKETLVGLKDEELAKVDARRKRMELFFAEPDIPKCVDYGG